MCLCVCILCQCQEPRRRGGGGVKRSLRMGFSNTGSSGRAATKRRQLEMPSLYVCAFDAIVGPHACDVCALLDKPTPHPKKSSFEELPVIVTSHRSHKQTQSQFLMTYHVIFLHLYAIFGVFCTDISDTRVLAHHQLHPNPTQQGSCIKFPLTSGTSCSLHLDETNSNWLL